MKKEIDVLGTEIRISKIHDDDYICLTDIAKYKNSRDPKDVVKNWMRNHNTVEYLGLWEKLNNINFNGVGFDPIEKQAGKNAFTLSPTKWIESVLAIGITVKRGNKGGIYAHKDIAFKFASWVSVEFELYIIKEFQRLKEQESEKLDWTAKRFLTKINYRIHTDSIKENLIPKKLHKKDIGFVYADEADILNKALFGITAREWREQNPGKKGNARDYCNVEQLIVLANLESMNSELIKMGLDQSQRLELLNNTAITQMKSLIGNDSLKKLH